MAETPFQASGAGRSGLPRSDLESADSAPSGDGMPCPNCGDPAPGRFCPSCGQRRGARRISLRRMLAEAVEDQLSINSSLPRTVGALLFRPGLLSVEYSIGRIERYIPPFRLYLVTNLVFFLLLSFVSGRGHGIVQVDGELPADTALSVAELLARSDSAQLQRQLNPVRTGWPPLDSMANRRIHELAELPPREAASELSKAILQRAPTAVFLMLPLYALLLQMLYFRRRKYYVEHFVFGLHTHAFVFVLFTVMLVAGRVPWIGLPLLLWMMVYGYLALRRYYGQGWFITLVKYGVLGMCYFVVFVTGVTLTVIAALLLG